MQLVRWHSITPVAAAHEDPASPGVLKRVLAVRDDLPSGRIQMINWAILPVGKSFQPHYHEDMAEVFVLLAGRVEIEIDDASAELGFGDLVVVPPRAVHRMVNRGTEDAAYLVVGISSEKGGKTIVVQGSQAG